MKIPNYNNTCISNILDFLLRGIDILIVNVHWTSNLIWLHSSICDGYMLTSRQNVMSSKAEDTMFINDIF